MSRQAARGGGHGRPVERARDLARVGRLGARGARRAPATRRCRSRSGATGGGRCQVTLCHLTTRRPRSSKPRQVTLCHLPRTRPARPCPSRPTGTCPRRSSTVDVVLPILHGPFGEDGTVQGLLELAGVPYVGAGRGRLGALHGQGPVQGGAARQRDPGARATTLRDWPTAIENPFGYPVFVKPARLGSSVGITKVHAEEELGPAVELAREHDEKVLSRSSSTGIEVECSVLGNLDSRRSPRSPARSSRTPSGTTTRRSTTRAGWT